MTLRIGSLCSGAGGLDLAVESVFNARTVWHCEIDSAASKVLAHHWRETPNYGDFTTMEDWNWELTNPVDILCAGWPCQPFSVAGKKKGAADERAIWPRIADAIRVLRPGIIVLENVSAVLRSEFQRVADSLSTLGYDLRWTCLRASDIGAPHQRERVFIVAHTDGAAFPQHTGEPSPQEGTRSQPGDRPEDHRGERVARNGWRTALDLLPTPTSRDHKGHNQRSDETCLTGALLPTPAASDGAGGKTSRSGDRIDEPLLGGIARDFTGQWGKYEPAIRHWEQIVGPAPSPTEPNRNGKQRLNPAFSEWMMGWPPGWVTAVPGISRNDQLRIVGNGVVPHQAVAALRSLLAVEQLTA